MGQCLLGPTQRPLPDNTQHLQETDIHAVGGIRTYNPSKQAAIDPLLTNMGHYQTTIQEYEFFLWRCGPTRVMASSFLRYLDHTQRRITVGMTPLYRWSARRRDLYLTTHNTQQTNIHAPGGIRTHDLSRRAAADLSLRPRGHPDRRTWMYTDTKYNVGDLLFTFQNLNLKRGFLQTYDTWFLYTFMLLYNGLTMTDIQVETSYEVIIDGTRTCSVWL